MTGPATRWIFNSIHMRIIGLREAKQTLGTIVNESQRSPVLLAFRSTPIAIVVGIEGVTELEALLAAGRQLTAAARAGKKPAKKRGRRS